MASSPKESTQTGTLQGVGEEGQIPKSRLATGQAARSMLSALVKGDNSAAIKRTEIVALIDGNPMFTDEQVKAANMGFVARANWGAARARIKKLNIAYTDILTSPDTLPTVVVTKGDQRNRAEWSQIFSEKFHNALFRTYDDWSFIYNMKLHHAQKNIHGIGPCFFRDRRDWRFRAIKRRNILVPKESPSDVSRLRVVFVRDFMYVDELYRMSNPNVKDSRWNKAASLDAMKHTQKNGAQNFDWEIAQEKFKNNAYDWAYTESDVCLIAHAFVKEFDGGKVSHHIFAEHGEEDYCYSCLSQYDHIGQAVWVCFDDIGNGDFEGVRGHGTEVYHFGQAHNRLNNSLIMAGIEAGTRVWQSDSPDHANKMTRVEIGQDRIIPTGLQKADVSMGQGVSAQLAVAQYFQEIEEAQTGIMRPRRGKETRQPLTATEAEIQVGDSGALANSEIADYMMQLDRLLAETFRRITLENIIETDGGGKEALAFKADCIEDGIPEEIFYDLVKSAIVTATRPIGNGSYADRVSRMNAIGQRMADMPARKRAQFIRDYIAYVGGARELADRYGPDVEQQFPGIEASLAILENNGFMAGGMQDPFSPDNAHDVHLPIHLEFAANLLKSDPQHAAGVIDAVEAHMAQHVHALEKDPTRRAAFEHFKTALGSMQNDIKKVKRMAELLAAQQQPEEKDPNVIKALADAKREDFVAQSTMQRKDTEAKQRMTQRDVLAAQKFRLAEDAHATDLRMKAETKKNGDGK